MKTLEVLDLVLRGKRLRPKSQKNYRLAFASLDRFSKDWPESSVVINEWATSMSDVGDSTVRLWFALVNAAGKYVKRAYKLANPCEDAERPKVSKKRRRYYSIEELDAIVRACGRDVYELPLVLTLIDSACRIGELVNLRGRDVGDGFIDVEGKTGQRRYRLDARVCKMLIELAGGDDEPVFKRSSGGFYPSGDGLGHRVRRIAERAGLTGVRLGPHTIRHSSASLLANETKQVLLVKALLQHDDIETSMKYVHDAEELVIEGDEYSPLRLLNERYGKAHPGRERLELASGEFGASGALVPVGIPEIEGASLVGDLFPEVRDGIKVRSELRSDDLILIRKAFVFYARYHDGGDVVRARKLLARMLRKSGSKRYAKVK